MSNIDNLLCYDNAINSAEYRALLKTYDAFLDVRSKLEATLAALYALQNNAPHDENDYRRDCYDEIRSRLEYAYAVLDNAHTSFSYEVAPEDS